MIQECLISMAGSQRLFTSTSSCLDLGSGLWLMGRSGGSSLFPSGSPVVLPQSAGLCLLHTSSVCCPLAGPELCLAFPTPFHTPLPALAWRCSCLIYFQFGLSESFFLNIENHQKFSSTPCPSSLHPAIQEPLPSVRGGTFPFQGIMSFRGMAASLCPEESWHCL